jgi:hypothetical protein
MRRVIGIDIHRTFGEVVIWENGVLVHAILHAHLIPKCPHDPGRFSADTPHPRAAYALN